MIDSALKKRPKFAKFIHPYAAFVETFEYPKGFKIPDISLFARESSLSLIEHVAQFTAQCGDVNNDFRKLRLFQFFVDRLSIHMVHQFPTQLHPKLGGISREIS